MKGEKFLAIGLWSMVGLIAADAFKQKLKLEYNRGRKDQYDEDSEYIIHLEKKAKESTDWIAEHGEKIKENLDLVNKLKESVNEDEAQ